MGNGGITTYKPEYCQELLNFFDAHDNATIKKFCQINQIPSSTFYDWLDTYPELSESREKAFRIRRETFLDDLGDLIVTNKDIKVNSFPLALIARRYGIKTKDDADNSATDKLADALKSVVTTYSLPDNGRLNADKAAT